MVSYVAAGTRSVAVNGNTSPGLPAGLSAGDLMIMLDTVHRDRTTSLPATPTTPSGWLRKDTASIQGTTRSSRVSWYYRAWKSGDAAPSIVYGPTGVTTDEHVSQIIAVRGALIGSDPTHQYASPALAVASNTVMGPVAGFTTFRADTLILCAAIREANATSVDTLTGDSLAWVEIDEYQGVTTPNVYARAFDYALVPTPQAITDKSFTVNGAVGTVGSVGSMWAISPPRTDDFMPFFSCGC